MSVVRFAPSPTGFLHIGGARTCLFNWLYARNTQGKFVLRIEDTNKAKSEQRYLDEILESMKWLGMDWDEIYYQSERFDIYREYAEKLLSEGKAYADGEAIIYKVREDTRIRFFDLLRGEIAVEPEQVKDQVLIKSDGSPAYNFCCVVDDALMEMTHIIRGDDHIANTPKQILLYEALGFKLPKFVHIPMIHGEDGSKMSKRHGATAITEYRNQGFLPEALINYLALLGWNPGNNKEIFSITELIKIFSLKRINKTAAIFDMNKLNWINGQYIKAYDSEKLYTLIETYLKKSGVVSEDVDREWLAGLIGLYKTRFHTVNHFLELTRFFFEDSINYDRDAAEKFLQGETAADKLEAFRKMAEEISSFDIKTIEDESRGLVEKLGIKTADMIHPLRVALTGVTVSPGIFEVMYFLGKDKVLARLDKVIKNIRSGSPMFDKFDEL